MHKTSPKVFKEIELERPRCERKDLFDDHVCVGRSTMEHCFVYAGKQIPDKWAVIRLCEWAHSVGVCHGGAGLNKDINEFIALSHATDDDLANYSKRDWVQRKKYLHQKYGGKIIKKSKSQKG